MGLCFFGLVSLSFFRLWYIGTVNLDGLPMYLPWEIVRRTIFFILMSGAGISFLKIFGQEIDEKHLNRLFFSSLLIQLAALFTLPLTSNDIVSNLAFGKMSHLGLDPGLAGASVLPLDDPFRQFVSARWMNMPMVYGPIIGWFNYLATRPESLWESIVLYKLISFFFAAIITIMALVYCRRNFEGREKCRSFAFFALNPLFIWEISSQAHNDAIMVMGIMAFLIFAAKDRPWEALGFLAFAATAKFAMLPALAFYFFYLFFKSKKHFAWFSILFVGGGLIFAYQFSDKLGTVLAIPSSRGILASRLTGTPLFLIFKLLEPAGEYIQMLCYNIYWSCAMIFMSALGIYLAWNTRSREKLFLNIFLFIFLFNLIASPTYQPWYLIWTLPFVMALENNRLKNFIAILSVVSMAQYAILNSYTGAIINIIVLAVFIVLKPYKQVA